MKSASLACHDMHGCWQPDAQLLFLPKTSTHALHGADPAPSNDLVRGRNLPVVHASERLQREKT